jgi:hypothetical protein
MTDKRMETPELSDDQIRDYWQRLQPMRTFDVNGLQQTFTDDASWISAREPDPNTDAVIRLLVGTSDQNWGYVAVNLTDEQARELLLTLADAINASRR